MLCLFLFSLSLCVRTCVTYILIGSESMLISVFEVITEPPCRTHTRLLEVHSSEELLSWPLYIFLILA